MTWPLFRGQFVQVDIGLSEPKLVLVVSNNRRNQYLSSVLAVRLTTTAKPPLPSIVELGHPEVFAGRVICDDIIEIFDNEVLKVVGGITGPGLAAVDLALKAALGIE